MSLLAVAGVLSVTALAIWWSWGKRPSMHRNLDSSRLNVLLEALLKRGYHQGSLIIEVGSDPEPKRFVQFGKYIQNGHVIGLRFDFPRVAWSEPYYASLRNVLQQRGIPYQAVPTGRADTREFVVVDLGADIALATSLAQLVIEDVFGIRDYSTLRAFFQGVSPKDEAIGA